MVSNSELVSSSVKIEHCKSKSRHKEQLVTESFASKMVDRLGFEPRTPTMPMWYPTKLSHHPDEFLGRI
jgi:hypothetical protein